MSSCRWAWIIPLFVYICGASPILGQNRYRPNQPASAPATTTQSPVTESLVPAGQLPVDGNGTVAKNLEQPVFVADRSPLTSPTLESFRWENGMNDVADGLEQGLLNSSQPIDFTKFEGGTLLAVVDKEPILLGDLIDPRKVPAHQREHPSFEATLRKMLSEKIVKKSLVQRFFNDQLVGKTLKERRDIESKMKTKVTQVFFNEVLPGIMQDQNCESLDEFCDLAEQQGMNLQTLKETYTETILAQQCIRENVPNKPSVDLEEMNTYYKENQSEFYQIAKVRFQILTAAFSKYRNRDEADQAIREMGDEVFYGTPFETVAKAKSSGMNAESGGFVDWTSQGALKSKEINDTIFSIEPNKLSLIIEDENGLHIVRVLERKEGRLITFADAQPEIKKKLSESKRNKLYKEFVDKVKAETSVWSRWPEDYPNARSLTELEW
ncbi:peptidylprolyl isomerase [Pirellulaceae bacterium SH449]